MYVLLRTSSAELYIIFKGKKILEMIFEACHQVQMRKEKIKNLSPNRNIVPPLILALLVYFRIYLLFNSICATVCNAEHFS